MDKMERNRGPGLQGAGTGEGSKVQDSSHVFSITEESERASPPIPMRPPKPRRVRAQRRRRQRILGFTRRVLSVIAWSGAAVLLVITAGSSITGPPGSNFIGGRAAVQAAGSPDASAPAVTITLESSITEGLNRGAEARQAVLQLEQQLLQAKELEFQHEQGPPPPMSFTIPGNPGAGIPDINVPMGGPSDYDIAQIEQMLPIQADTLRQAAEKGFLQRRAGAEAAIAGAFYEALLAEESVKVYSASLERVQAQAHQMRELFQQGAVAEIEVLQVEAALSQAEADVVTAREQADLAAKKLKAELGLEETAAIVLSGDLTHVPRDIDEAAYLEEALQASAELAGARGQVRAAEKDFEIYEDLKGRSPNFAGHREKVLALEEAILTERTVRRGIGLQLDTVYTQLSELERQIQVVNEQRELAERGLHIARLQYDAGLATIADVLEAESRLLQAELGQGQAAVGYKMVEAQLDALLGRGSPLNIEKLREVQQRVDDLR